jgi:hypothetical protein
MAVHTGQADANAGSEARCKAEMIIQPACNEASRPRQKGLSHCRASTESRVGRKTSACTHVAVMFRPHRMRVLQATQREEAHSRTPSRQLPLVLSPIFTTSEVSEAPIGILRVQVVSLGGLPYSWGLTTFSVLGITLAYAAGSRYVVVAFGNQRVQTPVDKKGFNAEYSANESTFELTVFTSLVVPC